MIFGIDTAFYLGYPEIWAATFSGLIPNHNHKSEVSGIMMVDIHGNYLDDVSEVWLENADTASILSGDIFSASRTNIKALFTVGNNSVGRWGLKVTDPSGEYSTPFDILEEPVSAADVAIAVWEHILGSETNGMAGKTLADLATTLSEIEGAGFDTGLDSLKKIKETSDKILTRSKQQNPMIQHTITRGLIAEQGRKR